MVWTRIVPGVAVVLAAMAAVLKSGDAVMAGHWAYLAWLMVALLAGAGLTAWSFIGAQPRQGTARTIRRWLYAAAGLGFAAATVWLAPYRVDVAEHASIEDPPGIVVSSDAASISLTPVDEESGVGVAFLPGALVDPRAYIPLLSPLAEAGHPVYIAKPPLGIAFLSPGIRAGASESFPDTTRWVMAGHSLGGVVASSQAESGSEAGLILLASYPLGDLSGSNLPVLSVSGSNDTLTTPEAVESSRESLPAASEFVVIDGGVHAFFGDYGAQAGDGTPSVTREQAQSETVAAMAAFLSSLTQP